MRLRASANPVLESALSFRTPWFILATTPLLWLSILIFWGGRNLSNAPWFAAGVVVTALAWSFQGWQPWNMALYQVTRGRALRSPEYNAYQRATAEFFKTPRLMLIQAAVIALGALTPWLLSALSLLLGAQPLRPWPEPLPWWGMLLAGIGEAIRGRAIALYVLAGQLQRSWPALVTRAEALGPLGAEPPDAK